MTDMRLSRIADFILAGLALAAIYAELPRVLPSDGLWDFGSFVASGRAAREGLNPYGIYPLTLHVVLPGFDAWNPNLNPPISALLFQLFDVVAPETMFRVWWGVSMLCWAATVFVLVRRVPAPKAWTQAVWAFGLAGFWDTLLLGQIYVPFALAAAGAWVLLARGSGPLAGILIGLVVAMKPNFLVWPALLFLSGHRRPALLAVATAAAISAVPLLVYGPEVYRQWFELLAADRDRAFFLTNASLAGLTARVGSTTLGLVLGFVLLGTLALWAFLRRPGAMRASAFGVLASLIASPIAWIHYTLFLAPVVLSRWENPGMRLVAAMLLVPVPFIIGQFGQPPLVQATVGSVYNWALVLCAIVLAFGGAREAAPDRADAAVASPGSPALPPRAA